MNKSYKKILFGLHLTLLSFGLSADLPVEKMSRYRK